jgi:hypothetical protein
VSWRCDGRPARPAYGTNNTVLLISRLNSLTNRAIEQENALRMMCEFLKDLDDPYGFGQSLDERVLGDGTSRTCGGEEG